MAARRVDNSRPARRPARTLIGREQQMTSMAEALAERQLQDGTASAQVISHYLKLGSTRELLEQDRLRQENELLKAKVETLASNKRIEELYDEAIKAMRSYSGQEVDYLDEE